MPTPGRQGRWAWRPSPLTLLQGPLQPLPMTTGRGARADGLKTNPDRRLPGAPAARSRLHPRLPSPAKSVRGRPSYSKLPRGRNWSGQAAPQIACATQRPALRG